jgi:hypothetical protein
MGEGGGEVIPEKKITLFTNNEVFSFEDGKKMTWNGAEETPVNFDTFDSSVKVVFESGRVLTFYGIPYLFESDAPVGVPF